MLCINCIGTGCIFIRRLMPSSESNFILVFCLYVIFLLSKNQIIVATVLVNICYIIFFFFSFIKYFWCLFFLSFRAVDLCVINHMDSESATNNNKTRANSDTQTANKIKSDSINFISFMQFMKLLSIFVVFFFFQLIT